ncbi:MAG: hypothetical protein NVSMB51_09710 [Solirubrobacteraceae bacterium]
MPSQALSSLDRVLREAAQAEFHCVRRFPLRRFRFAAAGLDDQAVPAFGTRQLRTLDLEQITRPVALADAGRRRYWWFHERFWWEDDGLDERDVMALVLERERRAARRLERAHALMAGEAAPAGLRTAIALETKRAVWERCGGRCAECGGDALLEFDHVIPLAMGGSSTEHNLQLLCAECNRVKGAAL